MNRLWRSSVALALLLGTASQALSNEKSVPFGTLERPEAAAVQARAQAWLKEVGKTDAETTQRFEALWKQTDRTLIDNVADTIALGDPAAAKLLTEARDILAPAPMQVNDYFKNDKVSAFARANVALACARALSNRRVYEEALDILKGYNAEQVVDPAAFLFYRAVCEHALLRKPEATRTINRLVDEAAGISPERYKAVATLMLLDMHTWKDKDLGAIARKMDNIERRLELSRGGPQTQKMQKEVIARLDEIIKKLENQSKQSQSQGGQPNGGGCPGGSPSGGPPGGNNPSSPATEGGIQNAGGPGHVDPIKIKEAVAQWGRLTPREQNRVVTELTQGMSPRHREAIENYFRNLAQASTKR